MASRVMSMMAGAFVCAVVGSALLASPAAAGYVDSNGGYVAAVYNVTPYTWTLVAASAPTTPIINGQYGLCGSPPGPTCWQQLPAATLGPGESSLYRLAPRSQDLPAYSIFGAYFTYRVDVLGGPPEFVTVTISQCNCAADIYTPAAAQPLVQVFDTVAMPPSGYDPGPSYFDNPNCGFPRNSYGCTAPSPGTGTASPQISWTQDQPDLFDVTFTAQGNWTIDAATNATSASMADVLNSLCKGAASTSCSFTQMEPLTWGIGTPGTPQQATNCAAPGPGSTASSFNITYDAAQSASLTVGAGVTTTTELNLFDIIATEASVSVEGQQEWEDVKTFTRSTTVYIPPYDIASIFVVPVVGKVTGKLVVSNATATYTITNFSEQRSGVPTTSLAGVNPPTDTLSPAFNVLTKARPMTAAELYDHCHIGAPMGLGVPSATPPAKLVPEQSIARVELGQSQPVVARELGQPLVKRFPLNPCLGLDPACYAVRATGGTWSYRHLSVVFGPDLRVSALIYTGPERSTRHVGVGSTLAAVRRAFPRAVCSKQAGRTDCTLTRVHGRWTIKTVFRLTRRSGGRFKCKQVLMYVIHHNRGQASA